MGRFLQKSNLHFLAREANLSMDISTNNKLDRY